MPHFTRHAVRSCLALALALAAASRADDAVRPGGDSLDRPAAAAPLRAGANTACFTWSCNLGTCSVNSSCSTTSSGLLWQHYWNWGDGNATLAAGNSSSHGYPGGVQYAVITLSNWYYAGGNEPSVSCCVHARTLVGPPDGLEAGTCTTSTTCP